MSLMGWGGLGVGVGWGSSSNYFSLEACGHALIKLLGILADLTSTQFIVMCDFSSLVYQSVNGP